MPDTADSTAATRVVERRESARAASPSDTTACVQLLWELQGRMVVTDTAVRLCDICRGGFALTTDLEFLRGVQYPFRFRGRPESEGVDLWARVVHVHPSSDDGGQYRVGFAFQRHNAATLSKIDRALREVLAEFAVE